MQNRIIVEAQILTAIDKTGVEEYGEKLIQAYLNLDRDTEVNFAFFGRKGKSSGLSGQGIRNRYFPAPLRVLRKLNSHKLMLPLSWIFGRGVYLFPHFVWWRTGRSSPSISIIHDTVFFSAPETMDQANRRYLLKTVPRTVRNSDAIITISQSAKKDIIKHLNGQPNKIHVLYPGIDLEEFKPASPAAISIVKKKLHIKRSYILFQSTLEPRKNLSNLLLAMAELPSELKKSYSLVLAGKPGWQFDKTEAEIARAREDSVDIVQTGYIDSRDMPALYSGASLLASPSFYEGFGMNLLKALACATPVVTSNASSMPEVVGDVGLLVDPNSPKDIMSAIESLLTNKTLTDKLGQEGLAQAKKFNWATSAGQLNEVVNSLLQNG